MSRDTNGHLYSATPGAGQGTALRTNLAANLTQWTVGALYTFGAGSTERNFFVLSHASGGEILVFCPNGGSVPSAVSVYADYNSANTWSIYNYPLSFSYAPAGGFASALGSAFDPLNLDFWEDITVSQAKTQPTRVYSMPFWITGSPLLDSYWIEDSSREALTVHIGRQASNTGYGSMVFGRDLMVPMPEPAPNQVKGYGMYLVDVPTAGSTIRPIDSHIALWDESDTRLEFELTDIGTHLSNYNDSNQPYSDDSKYQTATVGVVSRDRAYGTIHQDYMRIFGRSTTSTYKSKRGTSTAFKFVHLHEDLLTPWDNTLAAPA